MFQAGVKGRSEQSKLIPCIDNRDDNIIGSDRIASARNKLYKLKTITKTATTISKVTPNTGT